jgi:hypothetical protein
MAEILLKVALTTILPGLINFGVFKVLYLSNKFSQFDISFQIMISQSQKILYGPKLYFLGDGPVHILPYDPQCHELFAIYIIFKFFKQKIDIYMCVCVKIRSLS